MCGPGRSGYALTERTSSGDDMVYFILVLLAIWLILAILGMVIKGLLWLAVIGAVLFVATAVWGWFQNRQRA